MTLNHTTSDIPNAIVTGGSSGLGLELTRGLLEHGYRVAIDGRRTELLDRAVAELTASGPVIGLAGDVTDPRHREALVAVAGPVRVLINNASELGGSPPPALADLDSETFVSLWATNVDAPLQVVRSLLPQLVQGAVVINISSDAAVEHYPGWGGYAATKSALDHQTLTWAAERPDISWYAVDPGDLRTPMHQAAFPGEDISDRPLPATVVPVLSALIDSGLPSGRYRVADLIQLIGTSTSEDRSAVPA